MFSREQLKVAVEQDKSTNNLREAAVFLLEAINDWPTLNLRNPENFLIELKKAIPTELNSKNIENYQKQLSLSNDAWRIESLTILLLMFDVLNKESPDITLESALLKMKKHYTLEDVE